MQANLTVLQAELEDALATAELLNSNLRMDQAVLRQRLSDERETSKHLRSELTKAEALISKLNHEKTQHETQCKATREHLRLEQFHAAQLTKDVAQLRAEIDSLKLRKVALEYSIIRLLWVILW